MQKEKLTDAQRELVEANLGLARLAAWKFRESCAKVGIDWEDAFSIACMGLIKAARNYNPALATGCYYLSRSCETAIMMELRKLRQPSRCTAFTVSIDTPVYSDGENNDLTIADMLVAPGPGVDEECCAALLVSSAMKCITPRQAEILQLAQDGLTQQEIGRLIGCSQSYVSRLINACRKQIQEAIA